jgi:hypothetical protein
VPHLSPTTLTTDEQRLILHATAGNVRDHTIISLALGTGVRLGEIVGLNVGDVFAPDGTPRVRVRIRAAIAKGGRAADVFLPDRLVVKLKRFWRCKRERGEDLSADAPLFANQSGRRISKRRVQFAWATWQRRARFDRRYGFHKDGSKIKTLYYACGGWVMKGASACEKFLIRKEPLEDLLLETIQRRLQSLLAGEGETILRGYIEDETRCPRPGPPSRAGDDTSPDRRDRLESQRAPGGPVGRHEGVRGRQAPRSWGRATQAPESA